MVRKKDCLALMSICILMMGCATKPVQSNDIEKYKMYNPNCTRDSQHVPVERFGSVEWQEKSSIADLCQSLGYYRSLGY